MQIILERVNSDVVDLTLGFLSEQTDGIVRQLLFSSKLARLLHEISMARAIL